MSETEEQEISAIEQGFKRALIEAFIVLHFATSDAQSRWNDGAVMRFSKALKSARIARALALKAIAEEL